VRTTRQIALLATKHLFTQACPLLCAAQALVAERQARQRALFLAQAAQASEDSRRRQAQRQAERSFVLKPAPSCDDTAVSRRHLF
jgi:mannose/cellobiose epimerase-like protein (N-acyl-D-glucosamine 2-epimerase family)